MINLTLYLRCKEEEFWVKVYKKALAAKTTMGAVGRMTIGLLKSILFAPFMLPIKLLVRFVFKISDDLGCDITERKLFDKFCVLNEECKSLKEEIEAKFC